MSRVSKKPASALLKSVTRLSTQLEAGIPGAWVTAMYASKLYFRKWSTATLGYRGFSPGSPSTNTITIGLTFPSTRAYSLDSSVQSPPLVNFVLESCFKQLIEIYNGSEYDISDSVLANDDFIWQAAYAGGVSLCLVAFTKSWSGRRISYSMCIANAACDFAAVIPIGTLALSSIETTKRTLLSNNVAMFFRYLFVAMVNSASSCRLRILFLALRILTGTVLIWRFLAVS